MSKHNPDSPHEVAARAAHRSESSAPRCAPGPERHSKFGRTANVHNPNAPSAIRSRSENKTLPGAPKLLKGRKQRRGDGRTKDPGSGFAGHYGDTREPLGRPISTEIKFEPVITVPEKTFERDKDFPPCKVRLEDHPNRAALAAQYESFARTGFLPRAMSRLLGLHPEDVKKLATTAQP